MTLPPPEHLKKHSQFLQLREKGVFIPTLGVLVQALAQPEQKNYRVGMTVSKKLDKRAVVRNRIRRRLWAVVRDIFPKSAPAGYDYVLIGRTATLKRPFEALRRDVLYALHQIKGDKLEPKEEENVGL